jgi:hypothetical protein
MSLEPDRNQIEIFVEALFRHAGQKGFASMRAFFDEANAKPFFRISPVAMSGGLRFLIDIADDDARRAANDPKKIVFCPPIAVFKDQQRARQEDISEGLTLSVECDEHPDEAKASLESILGPATVVVKSGGQWIDNDDKPHDKLHLHWRLRVPARTADELAKLKRARDLAARLVGGDPSNKPVCHPIRWPGSWHRKAEPRLCTIATANPDQEIDLHDALNALTATTGTTSSNKQNGKDQEPPSKWQDLIAGVLNGEDYHNGIVRLAAKLLHSGMNDGAAVNLIRGWMHASAGEHDDRWQSRYDDIPRAVSTARDKISDDKAGAADLVMLSSREFVANFVAPDPLIESILQRGFLYALTAHTGRGKSALALLFTALIALGRSLGFLDVEKGRCLYLAGENHTDIRYRWIAMAQQMDFDPDAIDVHFIEGRFSIPKKIGALKRLAERLGGLDFIVIDSSAAFFEGDDENNNAQASRHASNLRELTTLPGNPCVLALCHPPKNAGEDNLQPRGGGAYVAEIDGNLTATKDDMTITLYWQTKLRGADFTPINFLLRTVTHERLVSKTGRLMPTVVASLLTDTAKEEMTKAKRNDEDRVLQALDNNPDASFADLAAKLNWLTLKGGPNKSKVQRAVERLHRNKLLNKDRDRYELTAKGKKVLKKE